MNLDKKNKADIICVQVSMWIQHALMN